MGTRGKTWRRQWDQEQLKALLISRAVHTDSGCWHLADHPLDEYTAIRVDGRKYGIHVVAAWAWHGGPIPSGRYLIAMHSCDHPGCFNPEHVQRATQRDNVQDAIAKQRRRQRWMTQYCAKGHEFTAANTYYYQNKRQCRTCRRLFAKVRYRSDLTSPPPAA